MQKRNDRSSDTGPQASELEELCRELTIKKAEREKLINKLIECVRFTIGDTPMNANYQYWSENEDKVLMLLHEEGLSFSEIAREFKCTRNAVAGRIYRLRQRSRPPRE